MKQFTISRIHTSKGIFRLSGMVSEHVSICYSSAEYMGTDGWVELDLEFTQAKKILAEIEQEVVSHIRNEQDN
ncbi:hypothetical protein [Vibrio sp. SCSIO 43137]|uniref:hypothetical protein n=1 Tax=Vibrio sp. SCSIO 43137 TaxID=3021011 RepID=UPI002307067A|nr:hypothetical protein [Vibrio sp. SCSIO 43137]WCE30926.1 hypothetical protein PK654_06575 [Vibrio sp. SCSIO 43137]